MHTVVPFISIARKISSYRARELVYKNEKWKKDRFVITNYVSIEAVTGRRRGVGDARMRTRKIDVSAMRRRANLIKTLVRRSINISRADTRFVSSKVSI